MARVVIVSTSFEEQTKLEEMLALHRGGHHGSAEHGGTPFSFETTVSFGQEPEYWTNVDVLVLRVFEDPALQFAFLHKLETVNKSVRLIILAESFSPQLMQVSQVIPRVRLLKLPVEGYTLYRSLIDLTTDYPPGQTQIHPRYLTDLNVDVVSDLKSLKRDARMKNLSIGGAYFEVTESSASFQKGDLIRMGVEIPAKRRYDFDARVVWVRSGPQGDVVGYGCTFLNKEEVYDSLLAQVGP